MRKILCIALAACFIAPALAEGEVYRWKDANGLWHYSDQPHPGAELVKKPGGRAASSSSANSAPSPQASAAAESITLPVSREVAQQVRQEAATAKTEQCKKATEAYTTAIQSRRLYREDAQGNRVFLSSAEIDAARLEARSTRDIACGPSP